MRRSNLEWTQIFPSPLAGEGVLRSMTDEGGRAKRDGFATMIEEAVSLRSTPLIRPDFVGPPSPPRGAEPGTAALVRAEPRRHHHRPLVGRPLRRAGRRPPRGYGELFQGG